MGTLVKYRKGYLTTVAFTVLITIISTFSVRSVSISNTTSSGKCDHVRERKWQVVCSSYSQIPTDIANSVNVHVLIMANGKNHIDILTNGSLIRSRLTHLSLLNLDNCQIRVIEQGAFAGSNDLVLISLSNNLITVLNPDIFKDAPHLYAIHVDNNPITKIEDGKAFPNFTQLVRLDLSNCNLDTIPANVFDGVNLSWLNLTGNNLNYMDWRVLQDKNNLTRLNLEDNPWHCDCHVKFLMESMKNMSLAKGFKNVICTSAEIPKWKGYLWNQVPEEDMTCHPEINRLVYSSSSPLPQLSDHGDGEGLVKNVTLELGQDVFIKCEYSGFPKPEVRWFKDNHLIIKNLNESTLSPGNPTQIKPKVDFLDDLPSASQNMEQDKNFDFKFREILVIRRIQVEDKGTYACVIFHKHVSLHKDVTLPEINIPGKEKEGTNLLIWMWISIGLGTLTAVLIATFIVITWIKKGRGEERGIIQEQSIDLGEFDVKPTIPDPDLMSILEDTTYNSLL